MPTYEKLKTKKDNSDFYRLDGYFRAADEAKNIEELNNNIKSYHKRRGRNL